MTHHQSNAFPDPPMLLSGAAPVVQFNHLLNNHFCAAAYAYVYVRDSGLRHELREWLKTPLDWLSAEMVKRIQDDLGGC